MMQQQRNESQGVKEKYLIEFLVIKKVLEFCTTTTIRNDFFSACHPNKIMISIACMQQHDIRTVKYAHMGHLSATFGPPTNSSSFLSDCS